MLPQTTIPSTPEEVAMCLSHMPENEQCIVKGIIIGLNEARKSSKPRQERQTAQERARA